MFYHLCYLSKSTIPAHLLEEELEKIESVASYNNQKSGVFGCLLFRNDYFLQYLEGAKQPVQEVYQHISQDSRHTALQIISSGYQAENLYSHWSIMRVISKPAETEIAVATISEMLSEKQHRQGTPECRNSAVISLFQQYAHRYEEADYGHKPSG